MPLRMPGCWDGQKVLAERHRLSACKDDFGIRLGREFGAVDDALGREVLGIAGRIGNVIPMREDNPDSIGFRGS